jgi:S1-C subfamily serine protease
VSTGDSRLQLFLETAGFRVPVDEFPFKIGNASTCDFQIEDDPGVSPLHAEIVRGEGDSFLLLDTDSDTGVRANGRIVVGRHRIAHGDVFGIGAAEFKAEFERIAVDAETVADERAARAAAAAGAEPPAAPPQTQSGGPSSRPAPPQSRGRLKPWMVLAGIAALVLTGLIISAIEGGAEPKTVSELVREAKPSTMLIKGFDGNDPYASGSAWVYDAGKGLLVTNSHVLIGSNRFEASLEGENELRDAEVLAVNECEDVAMLSTRANDGLRTFPLADESDPPEQGEDVIALGYPSNASTADELQVTTGSLSALNINWDEPASQNIDFAVYPDVHQVDAAINPGNSGGPLFDDRGKLIGMNSTRGEGDNQGFAISIDRLRKVLPPLADGDSSGWGGFTFTALGADQLNNIADRAGLVGGWPDSALLVESVIPGSAADDAGLQALDGIYAINGQQVTSRSEYCDEVGDASGEPVNISFYSIDSLWADEKTVTLTFE